jgi:hypothetical protein
LILIRNEFFYAFRYIGAAVWCGLLLLTAFAFALLGSLPLWLAALVSLALWVPYWLFGRLPIALAMHFPITRHGFKKAFFIHLLGAVIFVIASESLFCVLIYQLQPQLSAHFQRDQPESSPFDGRSNDGGPSFDGPTSSRDIRFLYYRTVVFKAQSSFPLYWLLVAIAHGMSALTALRLREKQSAELQTKLARAELAQLRTQLQPHFLFNTLNSVMVLMEDSPQAAKEMLWDLSELLRMILKQPDTDRISLRQELELLNYYVGIQKIRFGARLHFVQQVDEVSLSATVPPLLLQPLVENAIKHGIEATGQAGTITLQVQRQDDGDTAIVLNNTAENTNGAAVATTPATAPNNSSPVRSGSGIGLTHAPDWTPNLASTIASRPVGKATIIIA